VNEGLLITVRPRRLVGRVTLWLPDVGFPMLRPIVGGTP
jgi:hypothetical protein